VNIYSIELHVKITYVNSLFFCCVFCLDSPVIQCDSPTALLGQMNVVLTCEINARPEVTALYWITDAELGITIVAGDSASDFWTSNMASISRSLSSDV